MSPELIILKVLIIYYTTLSIIGLAINIWAFFDNKEDLDQLHAANVNGKLERTARMALRNASTTIGTHIVFLSLGIVNLFGSNNPIRGTVFNQIALFVYVIAVCILMSAIVYAQTYNQIDRIWIRNAYLKDIETPNAEG